MPHPPPSPAPPPPLSFRASATALLLLLFFLKIVTSAMLAPPSPPTFPRIRVLFYALCAPWGGVSCWGVAGKPISRAVEACARRPLFRGHHPFPHLQLMMSSFVYYSVCLFDKSVSLSAFHLRWDDTSAKSAPSIALPPPPSQLHCQYTVYFSLSKTRDCNICLSVCRSFAFGSSTHCWILIIQKFVATATMSYHGAELPFFWNCVNIEGN